MNKSMAFSLYSDCTYCSIILYAKLLNFTNILVDCEDQNDNFCFPLSHFRITPRVLVTQGARHKKHV